MKGKEERKRYTQLNAEFQRIAMRDKKAFLNKQCTDIEENNSMVKTRDLFKKTRDTKGTYHGHNKGQKLYGHKRSRRYLQEVARIHRRTIQRKFFMTQIIKIV